MSDQIINKILETTFTIHDLRQKIRILKNFVGHSLFASQMPLDPEVNNFTSWLEDLGSEFLAQFNQSNYSTLFGEMEKKVESLPNLVIYFAIETTSGQLNSVGKWLRESYGSNFIFDPKYDPSLIAGCAFVWKGVYKDYSLKAKINENHQQILEVIKGTIGSQNT
jgi:F0F1-type ATP synthase delta subunit